MKIIYKEYIKKAFLISIFIEAVLTFITYCVCRMEGGHTGFYVGVALHLPGSLAGMLIGKLFQPLSGNLAFLSAVVFTMSFQLVFITILLYFVLRWIKA